MAKTNVRAEIRAVLADGNWHTIDEMVLKMGHLIPPETAYRRGIEQRTEPYRHNGTIPTDELIRAGKRRTILNSIKNMYGVEHQGQQQHSDYRISPALMAKEMVPCSICGELWLPLSRPSGTKRRNMTAYRCPKNECRNLHTGRKKMTA